VADWGVARSMPAGSITVGPESVTRAMGAATCAAGGSKLHWINSDSENLPPESTHTVKRVNLVPYSI